MTKFKLQGHVAIFITSVIFALNIPIAKSLMPSQISPVAMSMFRFLFATTAFWIASLFIPKERVTRKDMIILVLGGLFGIVLNQMCFIVGLNSTSPVDASLIITLTPVTVMLIAAAVLKEPITIKKAGGVLLGAAGAAIIILSQHKGSNSNISSGLKGNLLCLLSSCSYAIYLVMTKPVTQRYHAVTLMKWVFLYATLISLPFCYKNVLLVDVDKIVAADTLWRIIYVLLGATFITYLLIPIALKRIRPTTLSSYNYLQPFIASCVAIGIGQDSLSWEKPFAGILIFAGVYFVTISKSKADMDKEKIDKIVELTEKEALPIYPAAEKNKTQYERRKKYH